MSVLPLLSLKSLSYYNKQLFQTDSLSPTPNAGLNSENLQSKFAGKCNGPAGTLPHSPPHSLPPSVSVTTTTAGPATQV